MLAADERQYPLAFQVSHAALTRVEEGSEQMSIFSPPSQGQDVSQNSKLLLAVPTLKHSTIVHTVSAGQLLESGRVLVLGSSPCPVGPGPCTRGYVNLGSIQAAVHRSL